MSGDGSEVMYVLRLAVIVGATVLVARAASVDDQTVAALIESLDKVDIHKAYNKDIRVNYQRHATSLHADMAKLPLFEYVNEKIMKRPTYQKLNTLVAMYNPNLSVAEVDTAAKKAAIDDFLDEVIKTPVMRQTYQFLHEKKHPSALSMDTFKSVLRRLWFTPYGRRSKNVNSCAFEHVFGGEIDHNKVAGLHDWIRFYQLEKAKRINYLGFVVKRGDAISVVRYTVDNAVKPTGSFLIGPSPEFQMAVYTLCFLLKPGEKKCTFNYKNCPVAVTTVGHGNYITTAYPTPQGSCKYKTPEFQ